MLLTAGAYHPLIAPRVPRPSDLTGLYAWYRAGDGMYDTATSGGASVSADGAKVARWEDQSGNGRHLSQSTSANQPVWDATRQTVVGEILNGRQCRFAAPASFTLDRQGFSLYLICEPTSYYGAAVGGGSAQYHFVTRGTSDAFNIHFDQDGILAVYDGSFKKGAVSSVPLLNRCVLGWRGTAGALTVGLNGTNSTATALGAGTNTLLSLLDYSADGSGSTQAGVRDMIWFSRALTDAEERAVVLPYAASRGAALAYGTKQVVFVGDSITQGYGATVNRGWVQRLLLPPTVKLRGMCRVGVTAATISSGRTSYLDPLLASGDVVVLWAGTNDISGGANATTAYSTLTTICDGLQSLGVKVVMVTPLPRGAGAIAGEYASLRTAINGNACGADAVADPIADSTLAAAWGDGTYDYDDIHPSDAGYQLIAPGLQSAILGQL